MTEASTLPRFGESALLTPANVVTLARCALTIPLLSVLAQAGPSWRAFVLWTLLSCTDGLDGWLARRDGTTRSGAFLDPLADKFLAIGGLSVLAGQGIFPWGAVLVIAAREVIISAYRTVAGRRGVSLPARRLGKFKTLCQLVAVGLALCPVTDSASAWALTTLWAGVFLAVVSAIDIVRHGTMSARQPMIGPGPARRGVRCEVMAVGTELLLGEIVDSNSAYIGQQLAEAGIDSYLHVAVGDNHRRMVEVLRSLLAQSESVIICGGLGPTPDDITREAIAEVAGVEIERREDLVEEIRALFARWGREMSPSNARQADMPVGATAIRNHRGTAPGLICEVGGKVVYAVPGVPYEMMAMVKDVIVPDLLERCGERSTIVARNLKTWGIAESLLAERIAHRVDAQTNPTIAFLARGIEGLHVRVIAKSATEVEARALIEAEQKELAPILGNLLYGVDDETMESVVLEVLRRSGHKLAVAESLTGGLVASRLVSVPGASDVFLGGIVAYDMSVKRSLLGVTAEKAVSGECAAQMAEGVRKALGADVGIGITGVAGPTEQDAELPGTVWFGVSIGDRPTEAVIGRLPGDRNQLRQYATISLLNMLRLRLLEHEGTGLL